MINSGSLAQIFARMSEFSEILLIDLNFFLYDSEDFLTFWNIGEMFSELSAQVFSEFSLLAEFGGELNPSISPVTAFSISMYTGQRESSYIQYQQEI